MDTEPLGPIEVFGRRLRELRDKRGYSAQKLAEEVTRFGVPWDRTGVAKLETGRRRNVTLVDLFGFSLALNVAPLALLAPPDDETEVLVAPGTDDGENRVVAPGTTVGQWITGDKMLRKVETSSLFDYMGANPPWKQVDQWNSLEKNSRTLANFSEDLFSQMKSQVEDRPDLLAALEALRKFGGTNDKE